MTRNKETFWRLKWTNESPHSAHFDGITFEKTEQGGRRGIFNVFGHLAEGAFGRVLLAKKKSTVGHCSSEEVLAVKFVSNKLVSEVEKEVLLRAVGHPLLVQLLTYFQAKEPCVM
jgi:serine/threonine protein kinase